MNKIRVLKTYLNYIIKNMRNYKSIEPNNIYATLTFFILF